jgi:hypothetical protein
VNFTYTPRSCRHSRPLADRTLDAGLEFSERSVRLENGSQGLGPRDRSDSLFGCPVDRAQHSSFRFISDLLQERSLRLVWALRELVACILPRDRDFCRSCSKCLPLGPSSNQRPLLSLMSDASAKSGTGFMGDELAAAGQRDRIVETPQERDSSLSGWTRF